VGRFCVSIPVRSLVGVRSRRPRPADLLMSNRTLMPWRRHMVGVPSMRAVRRRHAGASSRPWAPAERAQAPFGVGEVMGATYFHHKSQLVHESDVSRVGCVCKWEVTG